MLKNIVIIYYAAGLKYRSQDRSQVTMKNTCKFAVSSYLVGICLFRPFLT